MLLPTAMVMADKATTKQVLSAHPQAPTTSARPPRRRGNAMRRLTALALRQIADRVEPQHVTPRATAA